MQRQVVMIYEAYGTKQPCDGINKFLAANQGYEILPGHVTSIEMSFAGGDRGPGIMVVFTLREKYA